jgi:hypothetical protein
MVIRVALRIVIDSADEDAWVCWSSAVSVEEAVKIERAVGEAEVLRLSTKM